MKVDICKYKDVPFIVFSICRHRLRIFLLCVEYCIVQEVSSMKILSLDDICGVVFLESKI